MALHDFEDRRTVVPVRTGSGMFSVELCHPGAASSHFKAHSHSSGRRSFVEELTWKLLPSAGTSLVKFYPNLLKQIESGRIGSGPV
jgi:hypothetical protein